MLFNNMENLNLRDYFAAAALTGLVSKTSLYGQSYRKNIAPPGATEQWVVVSGGESSNEIREEVVRLAYEMADKMLDERKEK